MDTSTEGFMHDDDPVLLEYNAFRAQFGRDQRVIVALKSDNIFTLKFLNTLKEMHKELETKVPFLDDITSLYNVRNTRGEGDKLITDDLLEIFPSTQKDVNVIKEQAMASHFYKDLFISRDGKMTTIIIETDAYSYPWGVGRQPSVKVKVDITRFIAEGDRVYLDANWEIVQVSTKNRRARLFSTSVAIGSDANSIVDAMDRAFGQLE